MKIKKAIYIIIVSVLSAVLLCGCQAEPVAGEELILAAREEYVQLNSARVDVINDETGESEQIFIFKYDEKDMMTYSYLGKGEGVYIAQYNNGYEQFTEENGVYSFAQPGDDNFAAYSRDVPYPYADEGLILFYKSAVIDELSYIASNEQATEICHYYDISKLGETETVGEMTGFSVKYYFDGEGNLLYLKEITDVKLDDGSTKIYSYSIYITERNAVDSVPNYVNIPQVDPDTLV
ncbi:MAG: hypothetical protein IJ424_00200 [Oscillospiraceae bacterium]|nr:hypothetical protein [Oscillospiraceae bacterium]